MTCQTENIIRTHFYTRPGCCEKCPFGTPDVIGTSGSLASGSCFRGVDVTGWLVSYEVGDLVIHVRPYYCFDGASIPQWFWSLVGHPFTPAYVRAALLHDAMYHTHGGGTSQPGANAFGSYVTRATADRWFRELLAEDGVSLVRRWVMWGAVRVFGGRCYRVSEEVQGHFAQFVSITRTGDRREQKGEQAADMSTLNSLSSTFYHGGK